MVEFFTHETSDEAMESMRLALLARGIIVFKCVFCDALSWVESEDDGQCRLMRLSEVTLDDCMGCVQVHETLKSAGLDLS